MYEYQVQPGVRAEEFPHVCKQMQTEGWSLDQCDLSPWQHADGSTNTVRYVLIFKKPSKDISYAQLLINRYGEKLTEVADKLLASKGMSGIETAALGRDIKEFMFKGSPEDM
jgi:hypothetical protein